MKQVPLAGLLEDIDTQLSRNKTGNRVVLRKQTSSGADLTYAAVIAQGKGGGSGGGGQLLGGTHRITRGVSTDSTGGNVPLGNSLIRGRRQSVFGGKVLS